MLERASVGLAGPSFWPEPLVVPAQVVQVEVGRIGGWTWFWLTLISSRVLGSSLAVLAVIFKVNGGLVGFLLLILAGAVHKVDVGPGGLSLGASVTFQTLVQ